MDNLQRLPLQGHYGHANGTKAASIHPPIHRSHPILVERLFLFENSTNSRKGWVGGLAGLEFHVRQKKCLAVSRQRRPPRSSRLHQKNRLGEIQLFSIVSRFLVKVAQGGGGWSEEKIPHRKLQVNYFLVLNQIRPWNQDPLGGWSEAIPQNAEFFNRNTRPR